MANRWLLDEDTGEYINADDLDPSEYVLTSPWGKIEDDVSQPREPAAPEPTPPEEEQSPYALLGIVPKAIGTVQKGVGSLYEGINDVARWGTDKVLGPARPSDNPADFRNFLNSLFDTASEDNKGLIKKANQRDEQVLDYYNVPPDSGTATAINIGGGAIPAIGMTALGAMYSLPAWGLASLPAILPSAEKYQTLKDQGVDKLTAAKTAATNFALQSLLNRADIIPLLSKNMGTVGRALGYSAANTAANEVGTIGEAALDSYMADRPWSNDQLSSGMTAAGITGLASGPLVAPFTRARPDVAPDAGPTMSSVDDMFQRMMEARDAGDAPRSSSIPDSEIPILSPGNPELDPLSQITPARQAPPLIEDPNFVGPGRTPEQQAQAERLQTDIAAQVENAKLRQMEDVFLPEGSEVGALRQSIPDTSDQPQLLKNASFRGQLVKDLSPEERNIAGQIISASKGQKIPTTADVNPRQGEVTSSDVVVGSESESFPQPIATKAPIPEMQAARESVPAAPEIADQSAVSGTPISERVASNEGVPVTYVPTRSLSLSDDVPQWKRNADEKGVVKPLKGQYDDRGANPLQVYQRRDGRLEVVSGRHRLDLAQRVGKESLPAQIYREDAGYTPKDMALLDAELNIRDEHGEIGDYAFFFRNAKLSPAEAEARGLLSRAKGVMGFDIGTKSTPDLYSLFESGRIDDRKAAAIANFAPNDDFLQQIGIRSALEDEPVSTIIDRMGWVSKERSSLPVGDQGDLFGGQMGMVDSGWQLVGEASAVAKQMRRDVAEDIRAIQGASLRPERAAKQGVDMRDAKAVQRRLQELKAQEEKLSEFWKHPELKAKIEEQARENLLNPKSQVRPIAAKDLPAPEDDAPAVRKKGSQRVANRYKRPVTSSEAGHTSLFTDLAYLVTKPFMKEELPGGPIPKSTLEEGGLLRKIPGWGRYAEWMNTTIKRNPEAAPYVDAGYKIGQDSNTMMWEAQEILQPFRQLDKPSKAKTQAYLYGKRYAANGKELSGVPRTTASEVSFEDAVRYGLSKEEAEAAVAVKEWSRYYWETYRVEAHQQLQHDTQVALANPENRSKPDKIKAIQEGYAKAAQNIDNVFNEMGKQNYVPLSRFGKHYVRLLDKDGNVVESIRFEKLSDPNYAKTVKHFDRLAKEQGGKIERGTDPDRLEFATKDLPQDILDIMENTGSISGFPGHLRPARLVPGFEWDLERALADYSVGGARFVAMRRAKRAFAQERAKLLADPRNNALVNKLEAWSKQFDAVDGVAFRAINEMTNTAFIGGNGRVPYADLIGRFHLQYPLVQKYIPGLKGDFLWGRAAKREIEWYFTKDTVGEFDRKYDGLGSAILDAQKKGIVATNVQKHLMQMAKARDQGVWKGVNNFRKVYFGLKELTERSNNLSSYILGWDIYPLWVKRQGKDVPIPTRQKFAEDFTREANPVPTTEELPPIGNSKVFRTLTKFRLYQPKLIQTMANANAQQWARYLVASMGTTGVLGTMGGATIMKFLDWMNYEPEKKIREASPNQTVAASILKGPWSVATGLDMSKSAGFGDLASSYDTQGLNKLMLGMAGMPLESVEKASGYFERGQTARGFGALPFMLNPISNAATVYDWSKYGVRTKGGDVLVGRDEVRDQDKLKKLLGFSPMTISEAYSKYGMKKKAEMKFKDNDFLPQQIGQAQGADDYELADELRAQAEERGIKLNEKTIRKYEMAIREGRSILEANAPKALLPELQKIDDIWSEE